ncbi:MAG: hydroxymethylbilane synthase [Acidimicrobiales bacterium]
MSDRQSLRLATRGSPLALWQAHRVAALLAEGGTASSLVVVETVGDRRVDVPLDRLGGQGVFVKEVQAAVVRGEADAAVHSAKDLPASAELAVPGLVLAAVPERADPRDLLVGGGVDTLPTGSLVATGSARRRAQLANLRPDLTFTGLRGNLATRLAAVGVDGVTAVLVAKAAVDRIGWVPPEGVPVEILDPPRMLPQVGQGAIAVECRTDDEGTGAVLGAIDDPAAGPLLTAERAFLAALGGGCTLPVGAQATWIGDGPSRDAAAPMSVTGMMASPDGLIVLRHRQDGADPEELGAAVARYLLDEAGGRELGDWASGPGEPTGSEPVAT